MRRLILGVLFVLVSSPVFAQRPGEGSGAGTFIQLPNGDWVPKNHPAAAAAEKPPFPLYSNIDSPEPLATSDYFVGFPISGWQLDCRNGQQSPFVAVLVNEMGGALTSKWSMSYTVERGLPRPEVRAAYVAGCPNIGANTAFGYTVKINEPLPTGTYSLAVFWNDGADKARSESRLVVVK